MPGRSIRCRNCETQYLEPSSRRREGRGLVRPLAGKLSRFLENAGGHDSAAGRDLRAGHCEPQEVQGGNPAQHFERALDHHGS